MYQALYRKWRPLTFDDVVGQEHITETLKNQVKNSRLSHAYLFVGTRGTGKTTCAKILSRAVNCERPVNGNPCNECKSCLGILRGAVMDVEEMDAASNNGVDNVRALREEAVFSPASVKKRVYIIDEVHMLSSSAFNALLKILEEPPEHLMFILATTELHKVPATILSRCQRYSFRRIDTVALAKQLKTIAAGENISLEAGAADILARLAEGSMRDAVSLLDQCAGRETITAEDVLMTMGLAGGRRVAELLSYIVEGDLAGAMNCFESLWTDGKEPATLLDELAGLYRDILMTKIAPKNGNELLSGGYDTKLLSVLGDKLPNELLLGCLGIVQKAQTDIKDSLSPRITAEMCLVSLCSPELHGTVQALEARVAKLEHAISSGVAVLTSAPRQTFAPPVQRAPMREAPARQEPIKVEMPIIVEEPIKVEAPQPEPEETPVLAAPPESESFTEPDYEPEPEDAATQSSENSGSLDADFWDKMLPELKKTMPLSQYNLISDPFHVECVADNGGLQIYVKNPFAMGVINTPSAQDTLRAVAAAVAGESVIIRIEEGSPPAQAAKPMQNKIDKLMQFGNVKFE